MAPSTSETHEPQSTVEHDDSPAAVIEQRLRNEIAAFQAGARFSSTVHKQLKDAAELTAQEYGDRFLVELIQNAYDASSSNSTTVGVRVTLDEADGEWGSVVVANTGNVFARHNFDAICQFAQSDKTPGESIGNKGIGFRSVLQVSDWPEIYSRRTSAKQEGLAEFDGYCFKFADGEALRALTDDVALASAIELNVSPYSLPVPIVAQSEKIRAYAKDGFSTVIRLPLRNAHARLAAAEAMRRCLDREAPLPLFLRRLESLEINHAGGTVELRASLRRYEENVSYLCGDGINVSRVRLTMDENGSTETAEYLSSSMNVGEHAMLEAIESSVLASRLPRAWREWTGPGRLTLMMPFLGESSFRLYNYLPMGCDAASPLDAFLDAPFFSRLARTTLSDAVPLNDCLFNYAADLALRTAKRLASTRAPRYAPFVAKLLAWSDTHRGRLVAASLMRGVPFAEQELIPVTGGKKQQRYAKLTETYAWPVQRPTQIFTAQQLATVANVAFLDERVSPRAGLVLGVTKKALTGSDLSPAPLKVAQWAEALAKKLPRKRSSIEQWDAFYSDMVVALGSNISLLRGRRVLLGEGYSLLRAGGGQSGQQQSMSDPMVFLPPLRRRSEGEEEIGEEANVDIPEALSKFIRYTHHRLEWTDAATKSSLRPLFIAARVVRQFRTRELLEAVRGILEPQRADAVYAGALELAFRALGASTESSGVEPDKLHLRVPARVGGWIEANTAVFSDGWGKRQAHKLMEMLNIVGDSSPEMLEYAGHCILMRNEWPFPVEDRQAFSSFLERIGVKDGLWPHRVKPSAVQRTGYAWSTKQLGAEVGISSTVQQAWERERLHRARALQHLTHQYRLVDENVWILPGQDTHHGWPVVARERYSELVAAGLSEWSDSVFWMRFANLQGSDHPRWPSPVLAFVSGAEWLPAQCASARDVTEFRTPRHVWFNSDDAEPLPEFLPSVRSSLRRSLVGMAKARSRLDDLLEVRFWDRAKDAPAALEVLGRLLDEGTPGGALSSQLAIHARNKWSEALRAGALEALALLVKTAPVVVRQASRPSVWKIEDGAKLVLCDDANPLRTRLLEESGAPLVLVEPLDAPARAALRQLQASIPNSVMLASQLELVLEVNGAPYTPAEDAVHLRNSECARLRELTRFFIAVSGVIASPRQRSSALERLEAIRLFIGERMKVSVRDNVSGAGSEPSSLAYPDEYLPTLLVTRLMSQRGGLEPSLAYALAELLGMPETAPSLQLVLFRARQWAQEQGWGDETGHLPLEMVAFSLDTTLARIEEARDSLGRSVPQCLEAVLPVAAYALLPNWSEDTRDVLRDAVTLDDLLNFLRGIASLLPASPETVLDACRTHVGLADLRDRLCLDYARFNVALRALGGAYHPIIDPDGHRSAFQAYVERSHEWIDTTLRRRFWNFFTAREPLLAYTVARSREGLGPDPKWLEAYALPPEVLMRQRVEQWLSGATSADAGFSGEMLQLSAVRKANTVFLDEIQDKLSSAVVAWCGKHRISLPAYWHAEPSSTRLAETAHTEGWNDFAFLDEASVIEWLAALGRWPLEMPPTTDLVRLGLTAGDLLAPQLARDRARQAREVERRSLIVNGQSISIAPNNAVAIAELILPSLSPELLSTRDRTAPLAQMSARVAVGGRGAIHTGSAMTFLTDEQRFGIGFLGELVVREWLRAQHPEYDIDECWKSEYKNALLGRTDGDNRHGFDFELVTPRRRLMYEVKASTGDAWQFELGESEVREAQRAASDDRRRYRIVFVANVNDSARMRLLVLPNPFSEVGAPHVRMVGSGMRFRFSPAGS